MQHLVLNYLQVDKKKKTLLSEDAFHWRKALLTQEGIFKIYF